MGLRINTNVSALTALRNLQVNDSKQARSLERLATGLRINRGADDPSGLVISEQLRAQITSLNQAVQNSQNAQNMVTTADAAISEVSTLLNEIKSSVVFAQNTSGASLEQILAEQDAVDQSIGAIDRIANTTRFAGRALLNGTSQYQVVSNVDGTGAVSSMLNDVFIRQVVFQPTDTTKTLSFQITQKPLRARIQMTGTVTNASATVSASFRITGSRGTADVTVGGGASNSTIAAAINTVAQFTGVMASAAGTDLNLFSEDMGNSAFVRMEMLSGQINTTAGVINAVSSTSTGLDYANVMFNTGLGTAFVAGEVADSKGRDATIAFSGQSFRGVGNAFSISTPIATLSFKIDPDVIAPTAIDTLNERTVNLLVANGGLRFQLNEKAVDTDRVFLGIPNLSSTSLGADTTRDLVASVNGQSTATGGSIIDGGAGVGTTQGGFISSIKTGGSNSLLNNAANAANITDSAITQVGVVRGFLGAIVANTIEPNKNVLGTHIESLSKSLSDIRDLDFAAETSNFTKLQILFQSSIAVLASSNLIPQSVLSLLR